MPPQRRKGSIGGGVNPLADGAEHTPPVSPLRDAEWRRSGTTLTVVPPVADTAPAVEDIEPAGRAAGRRGADTAPPVGNSRPSAPVVSEHSAAVPSEPDTNVLTMPLPEAGEGPLSDHEQAQLALCESSIGTLRIAFWSAGRALQIVRDGRLYRDRHATFDDYVEQRWDMQRSYAHKLIRAWPLAARLHPLAPTINEGQIRELLPVATVHGEDAAVTVYTTIAATPHVKVTAGKLREAIALLPERFDTAEVVERLQSWLRGDMADDSGNRQLDLFSTVESRLTALTRKVVQGSSDDPVAAREFAARLRTLAEEIEKQITS